MFEPTGFVALPKLVAEVKSLLALSRLLLRPRLLRCFSSPAFSAAVSFSSVSAACNSLQLSHISVNHWKFQRTHKPLDVRGLSTWIRTHTINYPKNAIESRRTKIILIVSINNMRSLIKSGYFFTADFVSTAADFESLTDAVELEPVAVAAVSPSALSASVSFF